MKNAISYLLFLMMVVVSATATSVSATQLSITFQPSAGDPLRDSDFVNTWSEITAIMNDLHHDNIADSNVTWRELDSGAVNQNHVADGAIVSDDLNRAVGDTLSMPPFFAYGSFVGDSTASRDIYFDSTTISGDSISLPVRVVVSYHEPDNSRNVIWWVDRFSSDGQYSTISTGLASSDTDVSIDTGSPNFHGFHVSATYNQMNRDGFTYYWSAWGY